MIPTEHRASASPFGWCLNCNSYGPEPRGRPCPFCGAVDDWRINSPHVTVPTQGTEGQE